MGWLDVKVIDGILSLREVGMVIAYAFALGVQIGHGIGRWRDVRGLLSMVMR
jgi:hypothetical protein